MHMLKTLQEENVHNNSLMGLKVWWSWGSRKKKSKSQQVGRFFENRLPTWRLPGANLSQILRFWNFFRKPLKVPSLARSVPKPLKVPSLARSVPKAFKMGQEEGAKRHYALRHEPLLLFTADLVPRWSSVASPVRLPQVNCGSEWSEVKWSEVKWVSEWKSDAFFGLVFFWNFYMF